MEQQEQQLMKLEGTVEHVIYENADSGYAVFEVDAGGTDVVVAGNVGGVDNGMSVTVYGHMVNHPSYGEQFRAETIEARLPEDRTAILSYLSSGVLPYIGPSTAKKIVAKFGDDTLTVIAETPQRLCELKGITEQKAAIISNEFRRMYGVREVVAWFARYGMTAQQAVTCYRALGPHTVEALTQNPYLLCGEPLQLKFGQVDTIAAALQFETGCRLRVAAGLLYALRHNAGNGHTCLPRTQLLETASNFIHQPPEKLAAALDECIRTEELRVKLFDGTPYIYLPDLLEAEEDIAARLAMLTKRGKNTAHGLDKNIQILELTQGFAYAPLQKEAIRKAMTENCLVLTGGPGTGKTTTVNAILQLLEDQAERVALCAPTGRAAKRLSELTGRKASTIHRLLEVDYTGGVVSFIHNDKNLLKCDVVILDEMSMVDLELMASLLRAMRPGCRLVMVGDPDQLPSVGAGNVLGDLLRSGVIPAVSLTEIFRQAEKSAIIRNAHAVNTGRPPELKNTQNDFFFLCRRAPDRLVQTVVELCRQRLPNNMGIPAEQIQVLSPTRKGVCGTVNLNRALQAALNPPAAGKRQKLWGDMVFREGDRVMQTRNNYDVVWEKDDGAMGAGIFNGDVGVIQEIDPSGELITIQFDDRTCVYTADLLNQLDMAYAMTVHKAQGSEYRCVVLVSAAVAPALMVRGVLYTAITRARELLVLVGDDVAPGQMAANDRQQRRYSGLRRRLREEAANHGME